MNTIRRTKHATLTLLLAAAFAVPAVTAQASADTPGPGGGGGGGLPTGDLQALNAQVLSSFTASPVSVRAGSTSLLRWTVAGPTTVTLKLDSTPINRSGLTFIHPSARYERHAIVAYSGDLHRELGELTIGVNPCAVTPTPTQCHHDGVVRYDFARDRADFVYTTAESRSLGPKPGVTLNACAIDPGRHGRIERFTWALRNPSGLLFRYSTDECKLFVPLPPANYRGTLAVRGADRVTQTIAVSVPVKDLFIVSLGDSMASGEGDPDMAGNYFPIHDLDARWAYKPCHRSAKSGHSQAAVRLTPDPHTGVVFFSLACSGAKVKDLLTSSNAGQLPQFTELRRVLCQINCSRTIDALILTIGVNNANFHDIVKTCVVFESGGCTSALSTGETGLSKLGGELDLIRQRITALGLHVKHLLITEYPANVVDGGCAIHTGRIDALGNRLNQTIRDAATRNRWTYVGGIKSAFSGHSYCNSDGGWFRTWADSYNLQGDFDGTAHPNIQGQRAIAGRIVATYKTLDQPPVLCC